MTPEQALQFLMQTLVTKPGLAVNECAVVVQAWNVVAEFVKGKNNGERDKESPSQDTSQVQTT